MTSSRIRVFASDPIKVVVNYLHHVHWEPRAFYEVLQFAIPVVRIMSVKVRVPSGIT